MWHACECTLKTARSSSYIYIYILYTDTKLSALGIIHCVSLLYRERVCLFSGYIWHDARCTTKYSRTLHPGFLLCSHRSVSCSPDFCGRKQKCRAVCQQHRRSYGHSIKHANTHANCVALRSRHDSMSSRIIWSVQFGRNINANFFR